MSETRLLRMEEVAQRLGISYTAVRSLILYEEKIPFFKVGSRGIRVREVDLEAYIEKSRQGEIPAAIKPDKIPYTGREGK